MQGSENINIEVAFALPQEQIVISQTVAAGATVGEVLANSPIQAQLPEGVQIADGKVGIFGKAVKLSQVLRDGDRIELYRPLLNDPKEARRRKAAEAGKV